MRKLLRGIGIHWPLYPSGHFYSPTVNVDDAIKYYDVSKNSEQMLGIEFNTKRQLDLVEKMSAYYNAMDFPIQKSDSNLYYFDNPYFSYCDGTILHLIMAFKLPKRIIEIGSGYSTACMLDTIGQYKIACKITSIDLTADRLKKLISNDTHDNIEIINKPLREVDRGIFSELKSGDLLFIDSSHISKAGSELHDIMFNILPSLEAGVIIHFHDIFQNFEYPIEWLDEGISFNESYLLRAFLQYNSEFEILLFMAQLQKEYPEFIKTHLPICMQAHERYTYGKNKGEYIDHILGQSLYIVKK